MKIGFTGTRHGMTGSQFEALRSILNEKFGMVSIESFHHGDCVGADDGAATVAHDLGIAVICHPPADRKLQSHNPFSKETRQPKTHFARNRDIVSETDLLIVCPFDSTEQPFGGTWYTFRYARKKGKPVSVIWPNGRVEQFGDIT